MMIRIAVLGMSLALMITALAGIGVCIDEDDAYFEPDRAVGFSAATGRFSEIEFFVDSFDSLEMAATLALVHTDDSIHIYHASTGTWSTRSNGGP